MSGPEADRPAPASDSAAAAIPTTFASLRTFSYAPRGPWLDDGDGDDPVDIAEEYHQASKISAHFPAQALGPAGRQLAVQPELAFALGRKALGYAGPRIGLPDPPPLPLDLRSLVFDRRSALPGQCAPLPLSALATVLALSAGASPTRPGLRVTPSGGAMYPLDVFAVVHDVAGLATGGYLYEPIGHALLPRGAVDPPRFHARATGPVSSAAQPSVTLAVVASFTRTRVKYGLRGYRFALIEAGHLVQAAIIAATALGVASQPWGGFVDDEVDDLLELDGLERSCIYLLGLSAYPSSGEQS
jgi:SagB-type dehydrogenase family enzyme